MTVRKNMRIRLLLLPLLLVAVGCASHQRTEPAAPIASSTITPLLQRQFRAGSVSNRAAEWLYRCINGNWDWNQFGGGPNDAPANPVLRYGIEQAARKILEPYGVPKSMQFVDKRSYVSNEGHGRTAYRYRVGFEHGYLMYIFAVDADGNAGGVLISTKALSFTFWR